LESILKISRGNMILVLKSPHSLIQIIQVVLAIKHVDGRPDAPCCVFSKFRSAGSLTSYKSWRVLELSLSHRSINGKFQLCLLVDCIGKKKMKMNQETPLQLRVK
jgi:hypothetical protein